GRPGPSRRVTLTGASTRELVGYLSHPNGWVRDTAQRLLVERGDASATPLLTELALRGSTSVARAQALWTLEGLDSPDPAALLPALDDPHPRVQAAAIRVIESLARDDAARSGFGQALRRLAESP